MTNGNRTNWELALLKPLVKKIGSGITPKGGAKVYVQSGIPFIRSQNVHENNLVLDEVAFISLAQHELMDSSKVKPQDVLLNITGASIGRSCIVPDSVTEANVNQHVCIIRCNDNLNPQYLCQYINSDLGQRQIYSFQAGGNREGLNYDQIGRFLIPLPSIAYQIKIVEVLSTWDTAIRQTEKLITAKAKRKRGLMQQLLTGKRRFQEFGEQEWKLMSISDFTIPAIRIRPKPDKTFLALGIRSHGKGTFLKTDFDPAKIEMTELYEVRENDLIVNITFAWEGAIAIAKADDTGALVSHRFPTYEFNTELAIPEYFRHVIVQKWFIERLGLISPGGAGRNRVLSKRDFGKLEVLMPSVEEQRRIAKVLNACDREIDLLKQQLDAFKRQKRGLMQKLLTGQIRVKVNDVEAATVEAS